MPPAASQRWLYAGAACCSATSDTSRYPAWGGCQMTLQLELQIQAELTSSLAAHDHVASFSCVLCYSLETPPAEDAYCVKLPLVAVLRDGGLSRIAEQRHTPL